MSIAPYPGVQVIEVPSGVRAITGVATSITAFVGRAQRGPVNVPTRVQSFAEFSRVFGGLWALSTMSYAVSHFFQNGGRDAIIVRVHSGATTATLDLPTAGTAVALVAASPGAWGNNLQAIIDLNTRPNDPTLFNLTIQLLDRPGGTTVVASEQLRNLSTSDANARHYPAIIAQSSSLVAVAAGVPSTDRPNAATTAATANSGGDGGVIGDNELSGATAPKTGFLALDSVDLFNLLVIPPRDFEDGHEVGTAVWGAAAAYCVTRRAMLVVDSPATWTANPTTAVQQASTNVSTLVDAASAQNATIYFPRIRMADPLAENSLEDFAPGGAIAGIIARTDAQRGVWKAPAGLEAGFSGISDFTYRLTDGENGQLNPLGLNCLRHFNVGGNVVWGARTAAGSDQLASEWKYLPVRRMALFLEESLYRGTQWVVFEPNDTPLWAQIRLNIGAFLHTLFVRGAFQGTTPKEAYFVKCDAETTTQADIDLGIVNILVGFAPLKPAEFVILHIQQIAGQIQT